MITTQLSEAVPVQEGSPKISQALPGFSRLAGSACALGGLPVGLLLLLGSLWPAVSVALGVGISLGVCGLLFLFIERAMPLFFGAVRGSGSASAAQGPQLQFLVLLAAKLGFIALVGAAFLTLHRVNPVVVLVGFVLGQSAIVLSAIRHRKTYRA